MNLNISDDALSLVFENLRVKDLKNTLLVCKRFYKIIKKVLPFAIEKSINKYFTKEQINNIKIHNNNLYFCKKRIKYISKKLFYFIRQSGNSKESIKGIEKFIKIRGERENKNIMKEMNYIDHNIDFIDLKGKKFVFLCFSYEINYNYRHLCYKKYSEIF